MFRLVIAAVLLSATAAFAQTPSPEVLKDLAPTGKLRAAINYGNGVLAQKGPDGEPRGVSADLSRELARRLGVPIEFSKFDTAGKLGDAVRDGVWDVAFLGAEPQRAAEIAFTAAYLEIPATYLVPAGSPIRSVGEVDREGVRIAVADKSAYELWLSRNIKHAKLMKTQGIDGSFDLFVKEKLEALSGLRPRLLSDVKKLPGARILDGVFTAVQQAVGTAKKNTAAAAFLAGFVEDVKASGFVAEAITRNKSEGVNVAPAR
jgi:polar amino acid transport system substrate-binding protein